MEVGWEPRLGLWRCCNSDKQASAHSKKVLIGSKRTLGLTSTHSFFTLYQRGKYIPGGALLSCEFYLIALISYSISQCYLPTFLLTYQVISSTSNYRKRVKKGTREETRLRRGKTTFRPFPGAIDRGKYLDAMTTHKLSDEHKKTSCEVGLWIGGQRLEVLT